MNTTAATRYAILAHRLTGTLRTVTTQEAPALVDSGEWFPVCSEPEELVEPAGKRIVPPVSLTMIHHHDYGEAQPECPRFRDNEMELLALLPPEDWTADDLRHLHTRVCELLWQDDGLIWTLDVKVKWGKPRTHIKLSNLSVQSCGHRPYPHTIEMDFLGRPNPATIAWFARSSHSYGLSASVRVDQERHAVPRPRERRKTTARQEGAG
jgi:hypothetical protein